MSLLIRFEDTYGMYDLFSIIRHMPFLENDNRVVKVSDDLYIQHGASSPGCLYFKGRSLDKIKEMGVDTILFVFDIDNECGKSYDIWSYYDLKKLTDKLIILSRDSGVKFYFLPVVYCAETVLLYNYVDSECVGSLFVEDLVSTHDINNFYKYLIAMLEGFKSTRKVKVFREYVDVDSLIKVLRRVVTFEGYLPNRKCFNWLVDGCPVDPLDEGYFYTASDFIKFYEDFLHRFENRRCLDFIVEGQNFQYTLNTDITMDDMTKLYLDSLKVRND